MVTGGVGKFAGTSVDTSDASIVCRQIGPIRITEPLIDGEKGFSERRSVISKTLQVARCGRYRKVTRKIYDFSPEQQQDLLAIVWLYRGDTARFLDLVSRYLGDVADEGLACFEWKSDDGETSRPLPPFLEAVAALQEALSPFLKTQPKTGPHAESLAEFRMERKHFAGSVARFRSRAGKAQAQWE